MNKIVAIPLSVVSVVIAVGITLSIIWWQTDVFSEEIVLTQEEQQQKLVALLSSGALNEAIEASGGIAALLGDGGIAALLSDGENDRSLLLAELVNEDIQDEMKKYTRRVAVRLSKLMNEEEVKNFMGVASLEKDVLDSFSGGLLRVNVSEQVVLGILTKDSVLLSLNHFRLREIPSGLGLESTNFIEVVLLPDPLKEDSWMKEGLFDGSVIDLLTGEHKFDRETMLISFNRRPDDRLILNPSDYSYEQVAPNVYPLDRILYMRPASDTVSFPIGNILYVDSERGIFTIEGQFYAEDLGSPVFVLNDGEVQWAGVIFSQQGGRATVLDVQTLRTREGK